MGKLESSVPGLKYPSGRDEFLKSGNGFIEGRRMDDGAEGLWRIRDGLYDLENWLHKHPGGAEWLTLTKGTDITEAFETHHLTERAENLLPKFYVRDAVTPRSVPFTFLPDGFYRKFKQRALVALKGVDFHKSARQTNFIADFLAITSLVCCLLGTHSWLGVFLGAIFLAWTGVAGHNYLHARDSFRMYYMELCLLSTKEWRVTHVLSHHMYTNTIWDQEIYVAEPFFQWLPNKNKSQFNRFASIAISPIVYSLSFLTQAIKRYYLTLFVWKKTELRDFVPFMPLLIMFLVSPNASTALSAWIMIVLLSSFCFTWIGFNAAHHHPDIFHDGDIYRKNLDWGLLEMDAVRGREVIDDSLFLALTNFGSHSLHHLLPTVDHAYLPLCMDAFCKTCEEFGIDHHRDRMSQWELIKGQFQQLLRVEPKYNAR